MSTPRSGTIKTVPAFPPLEGDPPRPPSSSSKPTAAHQQQQQQRAQTPTARPSTGENKLPSFVERAAAEKKALTMAGASVNTSTTATAEGAVRAPTPNWPIVEGSTPEKNDNLAKDGGVSQAVSTDAVRQAKRVKSRPELGKQLREHYEETLMNAPVSAPLRDSFRSDAVIVAALTTNVFINDDWTICHDIAQFVARRYNRDEKAIMVSVQHGICYFFQGCFSPAYVLTLTLQPGDVSPALNRRNAAILQSQMHEAIGVHPQRGIIRFVALPEDCLAWNGTSASAWMAPDVRSGAAGDGWDVAKARRRLSVKSLSALRSRGPGPMPQGITAPPPVPELEPPPTSNTAVAEAPSIEEEQPSLSSLGRPVETPAIPQKPLKPKKSFVANLFSRRAASKVERDNTPLPERI